MKITPSVIAGTLFAVLLLILVLRFWAQGGILPPHEFAYGTALKNCEAIPEQINQFLSLEGMDPNEIQIQTFVGNRSAKNLTPLIAYVSSQKNQDFGPLMAALKNVDQLSNQKEKAIQLVKTLLPYKDLLRNEAQQDTIIVFVYYGLKQPSNLSQAARVKVSNLVRQLDTAKQSAEFDSGDCPKNHLVGNINIYPLALENTSWHSTVQFGFPKGCPSVGNWVHGPEGRIQVLDRRNGGKDRRYFPTSGWGIDIVRRQDVNEERFQPLKYHWEQSDQPHGGEPKAIYQPSQSTVCNGTTKPTKLDFVGFDAYAKLIYRGIGFRISGAASNGHLSGLGFAA